MNALILAGGYGTRLYPATAHFPKALLYYNGKLLLDNILEKTNRLNIEETVLLTNHKYYNILSKYCKGKNITLLNNESTSDTNKKGVLKDIEFGAKKGADWLILGSDNYFDWELDDFVIRAKSTNAITVGTYNIKNSELASHFGVVLTKNLVITELEEKPLFPQSTLISTFIFYFPKQILCYLKDYRGSPDNMGEFINWMVQTSVVCNYEFKGEWSDIGITSSNK